MSSQSEKDIFEYLESTMQDVDLPTLPTEDLEHRIVNAVDPIIGAKAIQLYAESQSPDAQDKIIRQYNEILNYTFMADYMNRKVNVLVNQEFEEPDTNRLADMFEFIAELRRVGEVQAGGKMSFFERHVYTDPVTNIARPILSLRLHSAAYKIEDGDGGRINGIGNYATIPVTYISDYRIQERTRAED